jgi:membrane protease YdiL (CAAX protease family)
LFRFVNLADLQNVPRPLNVGDYVFVGFIVLAALVFYVRYSRRLTIHGPQTRPDLLALPEMLAGSLLMFLLIAPLFVRSTGEKSPVPDMALDQMVINSAAYMALPMISIVILILARGGNLGSVFGLRKIGLIKAVGLGIGLALVALPLVFGVKALTVALTGSQEAPQILVQKFTSAVNGGDMRLMGLVALSACVIAPVTEEVLFRGIFYPVLARGFGRIPAAFFSAVFFALVHDTLTDVPNLAVLALCFTIAYEVTGSLLVPIFMHATFNGVSLLVMWWQVQSGIGP